MDSGSADGVGQGVRNTVSGEAVIHGNVIQVERIGSIKFDSRNPLVPRQVPAPRKGFVNRTTELAALGAVISSYDETDPPGVVMVTGMGGVGKTELVSQWVWRDVRDHFPGGQLYVDLAEFRRDGGVDVGAVIGGFLLALDVHKDFVPAGLADRAALFRTATAARGTLVVLDNAQHAAEVRPFLPGRGLTVVLSRTRLAALVVDGADQVTVGPLDAEAGVRLVRRWRDTATDNGAAVRLVEWSGGLPLLLRAAGVRLVEQSHRSMEAVVDEMTSGNASAGPDPVSAILDLAAFPGHTHRLYLFLGCFPGTTFTAAPAEAAGVDRFDDALGDLLTSNLAVEVPSARGRFQLHGLMRDHARRLARTAPEDHLAVLRRVTDFYLAEAARADRLVLGARLRLQEEPVAPVSSRGPLFTGRTEALEWLDAERANLLAVLRAAAEEGWHDVGWRLCESLWALYHSRKHYADWITAHLIGIESAQWEGRIDAEVRMRNQLARAHYELTDFTAADAELTRAAGLLDSVVPQLRGVVWETQGLLCLARGRHDEAIGLFTRALAANEGDPHGIVVQNYNLGQALVAAGRSPEALEVLSGALATATAEKDDPMRVRIGIVRSRAHQALGAFDEALDAATDAALLARELGQLAKLDQALGVVAELADQIHDPALQLVCRQKVRELRTHVGVDAPPPA